MNKKILTIGSIISAIVLILVTFTSVVSFQTVKPDSKEASPLFDVRSKRAIGEESKSLTCDYLRKGEIFLFPARDNNTILIQRALNILGKMSEEELDKLVGIVIQQSDESKDIDIQEFRVILHQIKNNPDQINKYIIQEKEEKLYTGEGCETVGFIWIPECWLVLIFLILSPFIWIIFVLATMILGC